MEVMACCSEQMFHQRKCKNGQWVCKDSRVHRCVLVLNVGIYIEKILRIYPKSSEKILTVNLSGCYNICRASRPCLKEREALFLYPRSWLLKRKYARCRHVASKAGILELMRTSFGAFTKDKNQWYSSSIDIIILYR